MASFVVLERRGSSWRSVADAAIRFLWLTCLIVVLAVPAFPLSATPTPRSTFGFGPPSGMHPVTPPPGTEYPEGLFPLAVGFDVAGLGVAGEGDADFVTMCRHAGIDDEVDACWPWRISNGHFFGIFESDRSYTITVAPPSAPPVVPPVPSPGAPIRFGMSFSRDAQQRWIAHLSGAESVAPFQAGNTPFNNMSLTWLAQGGGSNVQLRLMSGTRVTGVMRLPAVLGGGPYAGGTVTVSGTPTDPDLGSHFSYSTATGPDGVWALIVPPCACSITFTPRAEDVHLDRDVRPLQVGPASVDPIGFAGGPVIGASVHVAVNNASTAAVKISLCQVGQEVCFEAAGTDHTFRRLTPDDYYVMAQPADRTAAVTEAVHPIFHLAQSQHKDVNLSVSEIFGFTGLVSYEVGGAPVERAVVQQCAGSVCRSTTTNTLGRFGFGIFLPGADTLHVIAPVGFSLEDVEIPLVGTNDLRVNMSFASPGSSVVGTVREANLVTPIAGALIDVCNVAGCARIESALDGTYSTYDLARGAYTVHVRHPLPSNLPPIAVPLTIDTPGSEVTLDLDFRAPVFAVDTRIEGGVLGPDQVPVVDNSAPFSIRRTACVGGADAGYQIKLNGGDAIVASGALIETPSGSGVYLATVPPLAPKKGASIVTTSVRCAGVLSSEELSLYIDPSGDVVDTDNNSVSGATVTLLWSESPFGPFVPVPNGDWMMSPSNRVNPDTTNAAGRYGWDVVAGFYRVRAEKPGYTNPSDSTESFVESPILSIPPAVTDLRLVLRRDAGNIPPVARCRNITREGTVCRATVTPAAIDDGSFDPDGDTVTLALDNANPAIGNNTVVLRVTDGQGSTSACSAVVTVVDVVPPIVLAPPDVVVASGAACLATVPDWQLGTARVEDFCTTPVTLTRTGVPAGNVFSIGTTTVTYTGVDVGGNTTVATQLVNVKPGTNTTTAHAALNPSAVLGRPIKKSTGLYDVAALGEAGCAGGVVTTASVIELPADIQGFTVKYQRAPGVPRIDDVGRVGSTIEIDYRRRRVTLGGASESEMRDLLTRVVADGGARVENGQSIRLDRKEGHVATFAFQGGVLLGAESAQPRLRVTATAAGGSAVATAEPQYRK